MKNISSKKTLMAALGFMGVLAAFYWVKKSFVEEKGEPELVISKSLETPREGDEVKLNDTDIIIDDDTIALSESEIGIESQKIQDFDTFLKKPRSKKSLIGGQKLLSSAQAKPLVSPRLYSGQSPETIQRRVSSVDVKEEWNISLLYGAKYLSITQKVGTIDANLGIVYPSNVQLVSELIYNDWSTWFRFDTYEFSYETTTSKDKDRLSSVELGLSQKWLMGALGIEQNPLFNMSNEIIGLARQSTTYVALGAQKVIELPTQKPTSLNVKAWFSYPIATSSSNADVELSNITGFGIRGQVEFNRQIVKRPDYSLYATWSTNVGYQKIEQDLKWGNLDDKVKSTIIGASSTIGLQLKF